MTDYSNACIYKIVCKDTNVKEIYVGSTSNFKRRGWDHKGNCNNPKLHKYNYKVYKYIRANGNWDNWEVVKICDVADITNKEELEIVETEYYYSLGATLNTLVPGKRIGSKQRKEYQKNYDIKYQKDNREKINTYQRE